MKKNAENLPKPTEGELEILQIIWENGPSSVRFVNDKLNLNKEVGYTTTLKIMQIMTEKGLITRIKEGKLHTYEAVISKENTQAQLMSKFLDSVFKGSAMNLVMQALGNRKSSSEELKQIREYIERLEGGTK
jgi:BlaI family transcriptional regulator, penicillinase repressor